MNTAILIPARYGSTRYQGKPLVELNGVPMIKRVYDACIASKMPTYVLTDDKRIAKVVGPRSLVDDEEYENGTERCAEAIQKINEVYDVVVNLQGDAPLTPHWFVEDLIKLPILIHYQSQESVSYTHLTLPTTPYV